MNPAIERLMGRPAPGLVGHFLREAMPPEHHAALQAYLDEPAPPPAAPACDGRRGRRVLLAEDNPVNQFIAVALLERWGARPCSTSACRA